MSTLTQTFITIRPPMSSLLAALVCLWLSQCQAQDSNVIINDTPAIYPDESNPTDPDLEADTADCDAGTTRAYQCFREAVKVSAATACK